MVNMSFNKVNIEHFLKNHIYKLNKITDKPFYIYIFMYIKEKINFPKNFLFSFLFFICQKKIFKG